MSERPERRRPSENDFYTPTDVDVLRMENELLAFEVRFLRAQMSGSPRASGTPVSLNRQAQLEETERDLVLLLRRLFSSPLGPLLRRREAFRALERRYLRQKGGADPDSPDRLIYLGEAERDLAMLLRRLGSSPLGPLLRRREAFRTLEQRYL